MSVLHLLRTARGYLKGQGLGPFLIKAMAGSGAVQLAGMLVTFLIGILLARGLGVSGFGYYSIATAIVTLATIPGALGIPKLVTREVAAAESRKDLVTLLGVLRWADKICWRTSASLAAVVGIGTAVAVWKGSTTLGPAIAFATPMIAMVPLASIRGGALRGLGFIVESQVITTLFRPLTLAMLLFLAFLFKWPLDAPKAMMLNSLTAAATLVVANHRLKKKLPVHPAEPPAQHGRQWLSSSVPMALTEGVQVLQRQLGTLALAGLATAADVGLLRVAATATVMVALPAALVQTVVLPTIASLHAQNDYSRLQKLITYSARLQFAAVLCGASVVIVFAGPLLNFAFSSSYVPAQHALRILAVGQVIAAGFGPSGTLLNMTGHEKSVTRSVLIALVVNAILIIPLALEFASVGAALAIVAAQIVWNVLMRRDASRGLAVETSIIGKRVRTPMENL